MTVRILAGHCLDVLATLPEKSVHCIVTSPPYFALRAYGTPPQVWPTGWCGELGQEPSVHLFIAHLIAVFEAARRVLRDDGTLWVNLGDSYAGSWGNQGRTPERGTQRAINGDMITNVVDGRYPDKGSNTCAIDPADGFKPKDKMLIPHRFAIAMCDAGWWVRQDIVWSKASPMPESVTDRPTNAHEYVFQFAKRARYYYDADAVRQRHAAETIKSFGNPHTNLNAKAYGRDDHQDDMGKVASGRWGETATNHAQTRKVDPRGAHLRSVWHLGPSPFTGWTKTDHLIRVGADAADDDMLRIASPDCPVHASRDHQDSNRPDGEREADLSVRNPDTDDCRDPRQSDDSAPTDPRRAPMTPHGSSDSDHLAHALTATHHSTKSRKTDRAPETTTPCTPSAQMSPHTDDMSVQPASTDSVGRTSGSSTAPMDRALESPDHTVDTSSGYPSSEACTCSYEKRITESLSHFATFVPELPRRCILAGTSAKGACASCGAPWRRILSKATGGTTGASWHDHEDDDVLGQRVALNGSGQRFYQTYEPPKTLGWEPSCGCDAEVVPCVVLDMFGGSGTTGMVAEKLGRDSILIELQADYVPMIEKRITDAVGLQWDDETEPERTAQLALFGGHAL